MFNVLVEKGLINSGIVGMNWVYFVKCLCEECEFVRVVGKGELKGDYNGV